MHNKTVVFDLDETIGSFTQLGYIWDCLQIYYNNKLTQHDFNKLCTLFPAYFRTNIIRIFKYLSTKKVNIIIYTNNNGPKTWTHLIKNYIEYKVGKKLFNKVIGAYKVNGVQIEKLRTTYEKTYEDLLRCTHFSKKHKFLFFDDVEHPKMRHNNIMYTRLKPYIYNYTKLDIINTVKNKFIKHMDDEIEPYLNSCINVLKHNINKKISNENSNLILKKIKGFIVNKKTRRKKKIVNKTRKIHKGGTLDKFNITWDKIINPLVLNNDDIRFDSMVSYNKNKSLFVHIHDKLYQQKYNGLGFNIMALNPELTRTNAIILVDPAGIYIKSIYNDNIVDTPHEVKEHILHIFNEARNKNISKTRDIQAIIKSTLNIKTLIYNLSTKYGCSNPDLSILNTGTYGINQLNTLLQQKCPNLSLNINHTNYNSLRLCLIYKTECISKIELEYNDIDKTMTIDSDTNREYEGNKYNKFLRSAVILISTLIVCANEQKINLIRSVAINPISAWLLISNFQTTYTDVDDDEDEQGVFNNEKYDELLFKNKLKFKELLFKLLPIDGYSELNAIIVKIPINEINIQNAINILTFLITSNEGSLVCPK